MMIKFSKKAVLSSLLTATVLTSGAVFAFGSDEAGVPNQSTVSVEEKATCQRGLKGGYASLFADELTDEQKTSLQALRDEHRANMEAQRTKHQEEMIAKIAEYQGISVDEVKAKLEEKRQEKKAFKTKKRHNAGKHRFKGMKNFGSAQEDAKELIEQ